MYKLGIVGFGVVGKSVLAFLNKKNIEQTAEQNLYDESFADRDITVRVWDMRALASEEQDIIKMYKASAVDPHSMGLEEFIKDNDFVVVSPGIDLHTHQNHQYKFLCELDFFSAFFTKPVVAVTGSLGKTTVTKLITKLAAAVPCVAHDTIIPALQVNEVSQLKTFMGGNVGIGMLDLVYQQDAYDVGVLELSSFQLELNRKFAPDIAVWTNWHANHLDRHKTPRDYFEAKLNVLRAQHDKQAAVVWHELLTGQTGPWFKEHLPEIKSLLCVCSERPYDQSFYTSLNRPLLYGFYCEGNNLVKMMLRQGAVAQTTPIFDLRVLPETTFLANWIQVIATLDLMGIDLQQLNALFEASPFVLENNPHRLEYVATINGVDFYDDSKSTVMQSTIAAFEKLSQKNRPIVLILGGLGKGVDRSPLVAHISSLPMLKKMYCFGKECSAFPGSVVYESLEKVMEDVSTLVTSGDIVLFSPSGTSFDLFKDYKHRGRVFKALVNDLKK